MCRVSSRHGYEANASAGDVFDAIVALRAQCWWKQFLKGMNQLQRPGDVGVGRGSGHVQGD
jgi:hypothetical protein